MPLCVVARSWTVVEGTQVGMFVPTNISRKTVSVPRTASSTLKGLQPLPVVRDHVWLVVSMVKSSDIMPGVITLQSPCQAEPENDDSPQQSRVSVFRLPVSVQRDPVPIVTPPTPDMGARSIDGMIFGPTALVPGAALGSVATVPPLTKVPPAF